MHFLDGSTGREKHHSPPASTILLPSNRSGRGLLNALADAQGRLGPKEPVDLPLPMLSSKILVTGPRKPPIRRTQLRKANDHL